MKNLSQFLFTQIRNKNFHIFKQEGVDPISHRLFASDVLLFGQANKSTTMAVKEVLNKFSDFVGMSINREKSGVVYSKACIDNI